MSNEIKLPATIARVTMGMEAVCHSESLGPDASELLVWIAKHYSHLRDEFSYLYKYIDQSQGG